MGFTLVLKPIVCEKCCINKTDLTLLHEQKLYSDRSDFSFLQKALILKCAFLTHMHIIEKLFAHCCCDRHNRLNMTVCAPVCVSLCVCVLGLGGRSAFVLGSALLGLFVLNILTEIFFVPSLLTLSINLKYAQNVLTELFFVSIVIAV